MIWLRRRNIVVALLSLLIIWVNTQWMNPSLPVPKPGVPGINTVYADSAMSSRSAGSAACLSCHRAICDSLSLTAHYLSSSPASAASIKGSFRAGRNHIVYNEHMEVVLEKKGKKFLQSAWFNGSVYESEAFDIVIGSGRKGQSYLYWDSNRLFQLPVSYYTPADSWCNSPGYPTNLIYFNKQVPGECMECHATSARVLSLDNGATLFDKNSIVYGIDCERCHGPGAAHLAWHTAHPGEKEGRDIIHWRQLGRQQRLDACALCHSGFRKEILPSFSFRVGDTLAQFSTPNYSPDSTATLDVHGNQYGLLTTSKCFSSSSMDCSSCHNVHVDEFNRAGLFSRRCMNCHDQPGQAAQMGAPARQSGCTFAPVKELKLENNCIDCHMPALPSQKILLQLSGGATPLHDMIRTHHIGIYPDISAKYISAAKAAGPRSGR